MESEDSSTGAVNCSGSLSLDLPPGVAVVGGRRTLTSDVDYTVQPAADGSGNVVLLRNADAIITPLATLARVAQPAAAAGCAADETECGRAEQPAAPVAGSPARTARQPERRVRWRAAELRLRQCAHARRDRGLLRRRPCRARSQHGRAISAARWLQPRREQQAICCSSTRDRFLAYRDRCPNNAVHRRRLCRPDARDPRHHGRPLAAAAISRG